MSRQRGMIVDIEPCEHKWVWNEDVKENQCHYCQMWQFGGPSSHSKNTDRQEQE